MSVRGGLRGSIKSIACEQLRVLYIDLRLFCTCFQQSLLGCREDPDITKEADSTLIILKQVSKERFGCLFASLSLFVLGIDVLLRLRLVPISLHLYDTVSQADYFLGSPVGLAEGSGAGVWYSRVF